MAEARVTFVVEGGQELRTVLDEISRSTAKINGETAKMEQATARATTQMKSEAAAADQDATALKNQAAATATSANATKKHTTYSDQLEKSFQRKLFGARGVTNAMFKLGTAITGVGVGIPALIMGLTEAVKGYFEGREAAKKMTAEVVANSDALQRAGYRYAIYAQGMDEANKKMRDFGVGLAAIGGADVARGMEARAGGFEAMLTAHAQALGVNMDDFGKGLKDGRAEIDAIMYVQEQMRVAANDVAISQAQQAKNGVTWAGQIEELITGGNDLTEGIAAVFTGIHTVEEAEGENVFATNTLTQALNDLSKKVGFDVAPAFVLMATSALGFGEQLAQIYPTLMNRLKDKAAGVGAGVGAGVVRNQVIGAGLGLGGVTEQWKTTPAGSGSTAKAQPPPVPGGIGQVMPELAGYEAELGRAAYGSAGVQQSGQRGDVKKEKIQEIQDFATQIGEIFTGLADTVGQAMGDAMGRIIVDGEKANEVFDQMGKTIAKSILGQAVAAITSLIVKMTVLLGIALAISAIPGGSAILEMMGISVAGYKKLGLMAGGGYNTGMGWIPAANGMASYIDSPTLIPGMGGPPVLAGERGRELMMILNQQQERNLMGLVNRGLGAGQQQQAGPSTQIYTSAYLGGDDMPGRIFKSHLQGQVHSEASRI